MGQKRLRLINWSSFCYFSGYRWGSRLVLSKTCQKCARKRELSVKTVILNCLKSGGENMWHLVNAMLILVGVHQGAATLWKRSIELHNLRYRWMVSDGDSKAFDSVEAAYDDCKVVKLDCVGHVQKRMGKHLLNLKARTEGKLQDGKPIGHGRLTEAKIKKLQKYYGLQSIKTPFPRQILWIGK